MGGDQVVAHVVGMRGRVADALQPVDPREPRDQAGERLARGIGIGVHVLPEQRDFHGAPGDQRAGLVEHPVRRTRHLGATGIGHHAEGAELVAALLNRQERRYGTSPVVPRQMIELVLGREIRLHGASALRHRVEHRRQSVIGLRPDHQIDRRRAREDLGAFGLGDAAGYADPQVRPARLERP